MRYEYFDDLGNHAVFTASDEMFAVSIEKCFFHTPEETLEFAHWLEHSSAREIARRERKRAEAPGDDLADE